MHVKPGTLIPGILAAGLSAGPLFILLSLLVGYYLELPRPIDIQIDAEKAVLMVQFLFAATIVGAIIALPINALGANAMALLGRHVACARPPLLWSIVGAACGLAFVIVADLGRLHPTMIVFVGTSAICGWLCGHWVEWVED